MDTDMDVLSLTGLKKYHWIGRPQRRLQPTRPLSFMHCNVCYSHDFHADHFIHFVSLSPSMRFALTPTPAVAFTIFIRNRTTYLIGIYHYPYNFPILSCIVTFDSGLMFWTLETLIFFSSSLGGTLACMFCIYNFKVSLHVYVNIRTLCLEMSLLIATTVTCSDCPTSNFYSKSVYSWPILFCDMNS